MNRVRGSSAILTAAEPASPRQTSWEQISGEGRIRRRQISPYADGERGESRGRHHQQPRVLLLDEPFGALDARVRKELRDWLRDLHRQMQVTTVLVTHDQEEAMALSDRVALLRAGHLEQVASPREIYARPATAYTAQFIGQTNLLQAELRDGRATWSGLSWRASGAPAADGGSAFFSLRPEAVRLAGAASVAEVAGANPNGELVRFRARLRNQTFGGATDLLEIALADGRTLRVRVPGSATIPEEAEFEFAAEDAVFVRETK